MISPVDVIDVLYVFMPPAMVFQCGSLITELATETELHNKSCQT